MGGDLYDDDDDDDNDDEYNDDNHEDNNDIAQDKVSMGSKEYGPQRDVNG